MRRNQGKLSVWFKRRVYSTVHLYDNIKQECAVEPSMTSSPRNLWVGVWCTEQGRQEVQHCIIRQNCTTH